MKLLVLGGTVFLGRHVVHSALARGHDVTLFNRGKSSPDLFGDEVERLVGDRDGDLSALAGRRFDAAIDTCGYVPRVVGASADLRADAVEHYPCASA
ncbi:MAG: epimerase, partial [Phycisphaeraceae bacterium]|nr:epimerase [Phycisphaeraceae bacterium]